LWVIESSAYAYEEITDTESSTASSRRSLDCTQVFVFTGLQSATLMADHLGLHQVVGSKKMQAESRETCSSIRSVHRHRPLKLNFRISGNELGIRKEGISADLSDAPSRPSSLLGDAGQSASKSGHAQTCPFAEKSQWSCRHHGKRRNPHFECAGHCAQSGIREVHTSLSKNLENLAVHHSTQKEERMYRMPEDDVHEFMGTIEEIARLRRSGHR